MIKLSKIIFLIISLINGCTYGMESAAESEDSVSLKKYHMFCAKKIEKTIEKTTECAKNGCFLKGNNKKTKARSKEKTFDTS